MDTTGKLKLGFAALMILSGIGVAMYPVVSNAVAQRHASAVIDSYDDTVQSMDTEKLDAAKEAARSYNEQLSNAVGRDAAGEAADTGTSYVDLMDVGESLGYIKIPKIDVNLPIYEGTSDEVLLKGVGHLEGSSYPLGGDSTHSVLTGHRGLAEAVLFTDLDKMQEGDKFYLHVMDEVLAYQVDQVKVVEPEHTEDLEIIPGGDYCTLVTCTPYAINTHRMLVRGVRVPYNGEDEDADTPQAVQYQALNTGNIVKRVVDAKIKVRPLPDHSGVDVKLAKMAMNPFDEIAIEKAVTLREAGVADEVVAVTVGPLKAVDTLRVAMAIGADRAVHVRTDESLEPLAVAKVLRAVVEREKPDLVLLGKQAIDDDANQTGQMLSALCDMPLATFANEIVLEGGRWVVTRETDGGTQTVSLATPAVVTADLRLAEPRYVTLPAMGKARKKPVEDIELAGLGIDTAPRIRILGVEEPPARKAGVMVSGVDELVDRLKNEAHVI